MPGMSKASSKKFELLTVPRGERTVDFWVAMGPMFASEAIRRDLPTLHDEIDSDVWFLAFEKGALVSFSCLRFNKKGDTATLAHHWADTSVRGQGIAEAMFEARIEAAREAGVTRLRSVVHKDSVAAFERAGFVATVERAKFVTMEMDLE